MSRHEFRAACVDRDGGTCIVPTCDSPVTTSPDGPGEVHHIIERKLWDDGGYLPENGVCVCNDHHQLAEQNVIPPQAFWRWSEQTERVHLPRGCTDLVKSDTDIDKWGDDLDQPPWQSVRDFPKYPSTRHLPWSHEREADDTAHSSIDWLLGYPLVATVKMDGGNAMLVKDTDEPIRARNGRQANKEHFDLAKQWYWQENLYEKIPEHMQVFGEWLYAKHSIHYGCTCDKQCEDVGPALRDYFQVFGMFDTRYNLWLGWHETQQLANEWGLTMVPAAHTNGYEIGSYADDGSGRQIAWDELYQLSRAVVDRGHEGIVVRSAHPFHYGQIDERLGKYVRPGHVKDGEKHWSKRDLVENTLQKS